MDRTDMWKSFMKRRAHPCRNLPDRIRCHRSSCNGLQSGAILQPVTTVAYTEPFYVASCCVCVCVCVARSK